MAVSQALVMLIVTSLAATWLSSSVLPVASAACTNTCTAPSLVLDVRTCQCVPNVNCDDPTLADPIGCSEMSCDLATQAMCPHKCLCSTPSPLTNYCEPCYNRGLLDKLTCRCTCPYPFQGPQCEYAMDPCSIDDDPAYCSRVDCFNATQSDFFYCQRKCLCCKNKQCDNMGAVNADCTCSCIENTLGMYDAERGCALIHEKCGNDQQCFTTLGLKLSPALAPKSPVDCTLMQRALCPLACKLCSPPLATATPSSPSLRR